MLLKLAKSVESALKENSPIQWEKQCGFPDALVEQLTKVMLDFPEKPEGTKVKFEYPKTYSKVILMSGGMDSSIMWWLNRYISDKLALYVNFGHKYTQQELNSLQRIVGDRAMVNIEHYPLDFGQEWKHIIPTRNFVLLALAEQFCSHEGEIWLGAVEGESEPDKGDKSELFFFLVESLIWRTKRKKVHIKTLNHKTKNDWLKMYLTETKDKSILNTITCFEGFDEGEKGCGKCQACVRKWIALRYAKVPHSESYFLTNPYLGGKEFIDKYKLKMRKALKDEDFLHYSKNRCEQDLWVIEDYESKQIKK